jgi:autotransporter-associated beta strand protein
MVSTRTLDPEPSLRRIAAAFVLAFVLLSKELTRMFSNWLRRFFSRNSRPRTNGRRSRPRPPACRLHLEFLEDRLAPAVDVWKGAAGGLWSVASNWSLNAAPTAADVATFDTSQGGTNTNSTIDNFGAQVLGVTTAANFTQTITATGGLTVGTNGFSLSGGTFDMNGINLTVPSLVGTGTVTDSGAAAILFVNNAAADTFAGNLTGNLSLEKTAGTGTLTLTNPNNTYTGATQLTVGTLANGVANALPVTTALFVGSQGTYDLAGFNQTVATLQGPSNVTDSGAAATLTVNNAAADSFSGTLTGANLSLTKTGAGTLTLIIGPNTYGGITTISAGTLQLGDGSNIGNLPGGAVTDNGSLVYNLRAGSAISVPNLISGTGSFTVVGPSPAQATLTLSNAANTYTGATTINQATLSVAKLANGGSASSIGQSANAAANLVLQGGTLQYTGSGDSTDRLFTNSGVTPPATIDASGTGPLAFTNTGAVTIGGVLDLAGSGPGVNTLAASLSGTAGGLGKLGTGTWDLVNTTASTNTGATTVSAGTLLVDGVYGTALSNSAVNVTGGTLGGSGTIGGRVTINSNATINPGTAGTVGTLTVGGPLTFDGGTFQADLNPATNTADQIATAGQILLNPATGGVFSLNVLNTTAPAVDTVFTFINNQAASNPIQNAPFTNGSGSVTINGVPATYTYTSGPNADSFALVTSGPATHFMVSAPATATAGTAFTFTVTALDASNNTASGYTGTVHFTSSDGNAMLPANSTLTSGVGTFNATLKTAGNQTLTATDTVTSSITGTSNTITVSAAAATHFAVSAPSSATAGTAFNFTVTAQDAFNNTATGYTGTVHFTSSDGQATLPANSTLTNGTGTFSATLKTAGSQTLTATDTVTGSITGTSNAIAVSASTATHFAVSAPATATAGTAFNFTVTAQDQFNNTATSYAGTVHFTSSDSQAVLPANSTLTNGTGTFSATLKTAGNQTLTATDTVTSSITGTSNTIAVSAAAATHFSVSAPGSATAGTAFNFTVTALDAFNNTATGYTGTVHFTSSDGNAMLPADSTLTNGVGTFSATLKTAGNQTLTATDTVTSSITGTSNTIAVAAAAATHFSVSAPATATAGTAFTFTVTALDQFNNTATSYRGTVHFTKSDSGSGSSVPADYTFLSGDNGSHTFTNGATFVTAGNQTITATDTTTSSITGTSSSIAVSAAAATHFTVSAPATATAGTAFSVTVTALDAFNNTATGYTGTVHFTSSDSAATLPANSPLTNGVGTFSATLKTAGNRTLTATDTTTSSIAGTSNTIAVSAAAATHFTVSAPATATAGTAVSFTVTALDQFNNTATGYTGTVHFTSTDSAATLPANSTLTNGTGSFSATLKTAGNQTLTATDTTTSSITGTSNAIAVSAAAATHFTVTAPSTATAGTAFNFTVTALDANNNTVTNYSGTVHFTSTDAQATLPANSTLTNGTGTFSATLKTGGNQTLTATDTTTSSITGTSGAIAVSALAATHFTVSAPASATAGTATTFTVTALDANNNPATGYSGTVHFTSSDGQATLPANSTLTNGVGTFSATLKTAGTQTLTATDTVTSSITGTSNAIAVSAGTATHFAVSTTSGATRGTAISITVTALDAFNNTATGYRGTVHFTSTDSAATLPANSTLTNGVGTFSATFATPGNQTITATDTVNASITGTSGIISVAAAVVTNVHQAWVMQVYLDLLGRPVDPSGLANWTAALDSGASYFQVATAIEQSLEYRTDVVQGLYQQLLHRAADPSGLSNWVAFLGSGGTAVQVEIAILSSPEFFQTQGGGTNTGFLTALYQDVLGRAVDASGAAAFGQFLAGGGSRNVVSALVVNSVEGLTDLVQSHYLAFLHRGLDPSGQSTWVNYELQGGTDESVIAAILASNEFVAKL